MPSKEDVLAVLSAIKDPDLGRDVVSLGMIKDLAISDVGAVSFNFELTTRLAAELRKQPKTPPNQLMQLLRPEPKAGARPVKRVG